MILKMLTRESCISEREIMRKLQMSSDKLKNNLAQLLKEGFIKRRREKYTIA
jgi:DNA-binding MarR family transcriptional regulator